MADINFKDLTLEVNSDIKIINRKGLVIEVKQYLPIAEKNELVAMIVSNALDENDFANPLRENIQLVLRVINAYTNIKLDTEEDIDLLTMYDGFVSSGLWKEIKEKIPATEFGFITDTVYETISNYYKYRNSVLGILDTINTDYKNTELNVEQITDKISNKENLQLLSDVMEKLS
jgi:hypothetical protein